MKLGHVAPNSTKVRDYVSTHKAMSCGRMKEREAHQVAEVAELLHKAQEVDEEEDRRYGRNKRGDVLPEELSFREGRLRKIREAKAALEAEAQGATKQAKAGGKSIPGCPMNRRSATSPTPTPASCPAREGGTSSSPTTAKRWWTAPIR